MNILTEIKENAIKNHVPILMDETLKYIVKVLKENNVKRVLEIGSAVGYSAICFSEYVDRIDTIEIDEQRFIEAEKNIKQFGLENKINLIKGNAVDILEEMIKKNAQKYDFVFIDAAKSKYKIFLELALKLTNDNAILIADNVLYKGYVRSDYNKHKHRTAVRNLREFLEYIENDNNLDSEVLEIGDGLAIIRGLGSCS